MNNFLIHCFQVNQTALDIQNCDLDTEYVVTFTPTIPVRSFLGRYPKITFYAPDEVIVKKSCEASLMGLKPIHLIVTPACKEVSEIGLKPIVPSFRQTTLVWKPGEYSLPKIWVCLTIKLLKVLFAFMLLKLVSWLLLCKTKKK